MRHGGVYRLPDGQEYIAVGAANGEYLLFLRQHELSLPPRYVIRADGRVAPAFSPTNHGWTVARVDDTGETHSFGPKS